MTKICYEDGYTLLVAKDMESCEQVLHLSCNVVLFCTTEAEKNYSCSVSDTYSNNRSVCKDFVKSRNGMFSFLVSTDTKIKPLAFLDMEISLLM